MKLPVIAIFDIGKTNKKLLLFDQQYKLLHEESTQINETTDEDGFACEDIDALSDSPKLKKPAPPKPRPVKAQAPAPVKR